LVYSYLLSFPTRRSSDLPIYHKFLDLAAELSSKVVMIHPARFLFNAGQTRKFWNEKMLNDELLKVVFYTQSSSEIFPNTDIKGGVAVTYRNSDETFGSIKTFTAYEELNEILDKVVTSNFKSINEVMFGFNSYKLTERVYSDYPEFEQRVVSPQTRTYMLTNIFSRLPEIFFNTRQSDLDIQIYGREGNDRIFKYIQKDYVTAHPNLEKYKVILPGSNGSGILGEVLSSPIVAAPHIGHTQTFISFGAFESYKEAENLLKYLKTKFTRVMLGSMKIRKHNETASARKTVMLQELYYNSLI